MQPESQVITMNQQRPDRGREELRVIIGGIFDHVLRKEKENAILSASRTEGKIKESSILSPGWQIQEKSRATNLVSSPEQNIR
jgi:hypothetical protein